MERSIEASATTRVPFARAREVLVDDPGAVLCETRTVDERRERRFSIDLGVDLGAGASLHQLVVVQLGATRSVERGLAVPIAWRASGRERLLPTFKGALEITDNRSGTCLRLAGTYTVPFRAIGRFGDGVLSRRLTRSLDSLLQRLATRLESAVQVRADSGRPLAAPHPVEFGEQEHPEIYVG